MYEVTVKSYIVPKIDKEEIRRYARMGAMSSESDLLLDRAIEETVPLLTYKACYAEFPINISDNTVAFPFTEIKSHDLANRFIGCDKAIIIVTTIGIGADRLVEKYKKVSPAKAFIINAVCTERIESLTDKAQNEIASEYQKLGFSLTKRYSPGYGDLPLEFQKNVFSVLSPEKNLGATLNDSLLMSPSKSVSAIIGIKSQK